MPGNTEFAATLKALMQAKKLSRSDLARAIWGSVKDKRGYEGARNRDRIGHYLSGNEFPEKKNLQKMASVLGVSVSVLEKTKPAPAVRGPIVAGNMQATFKGEIGYLSIHDMHLSLPTINAIVKVINKDPVQRAERKKQP